MAMSTKHSQKIINKDLVSVKSTIQKHWYTFFLFKHNFISVDYVSVWERREHTHQVELSMNAWKMMWKK